MHCHPLFCRGSSHAAKKLLSAACRHLVTLSRSLPLPPAEGHGSSGPNAVDLTPASAEFFSREGSELSFALVASLASLLDALQETAGDQAKSEPVGKTGASTASVASLSSQSRRTGDRGVKVDREEDELLELLRVSGSCDGKESVTVAEGFKQLCQACTASAAYMYVCAHAARCAAIGGQAGQGEDDFMDNGGVPRLAHADEEWEDDDHITDADLDGPDAPASMLTRGAGGASVATVAFTVLPNGSVTPPPASRAVLARARDASLACLRLIEAVGRVGGADVFDALRPLLDVEYDPQVRSGTICSQRLRLPVLACWFKSSQLQCTRGACPMLR